MMEMATVTAMVDAEDAVVVVIKAQKPLGCVFSISLNTH